MLEDALGGGWLTLHARRCLGWPTLAGLGLARVGHSSLCFSPSLCLSSPFISPRDRCQSILVHPWRKTKNCSTASPSDAPPIAALPDSHAYSAASLSFSRDSTR